MWFSVLLLVLFVVTGVCWALDKWHFAPKRQAIANKIQTQSSGGHNDAVRRALARPEWLEYTAGLFGVIAFVFIMRSFLYEPFRIPSGSMLPTLRIGDFILVNKFTYGIRLPIANTVVVPVNTPQRGDVMVFIAPHISEQTDFVKRVVAVAGDTVVYDNKRLTVNGQAVAQVDELLADVRPKQYVSDRDRTDLAQIQQKSERVPLSSQNHSIWLDSGKDVYRPEGVRPFPLRDKACVYVPSGFKCTVPQGQYFVMGDNRDHSDDSRYWGFVPDQNVRGKAVFKWLNFNWPWSLDVSDVGAVR